jgi:hypothetical protein
MYKVSANVYFVCECQITELLTATVGHAVTERYVSLLFKGDLYSGQYDAVLQIEDKES